MSYLALSASFEYLSFTTGIDFNTFKSKSTIFICIGSRAILNL